MTPTSTANDQGLQKLTVRQIFDQETYRIPIYQRAYAWTTSEIHTLLRDVRDARLRSESLGYDRDYYLGSLVVNALPHHDQLVYEVIDGQQRLTTLFILLSVVPRMINSEDTRWSEMLQNTLQFEGRERSQEDLKRLARDGATGIGLLKTDGIAHAADIIQAAVNQPSDSTSVAEHGAEISFNAADFDYLLHHVRIVRTQLPPNTDLNHYFEVMNTRGEQLEKHEILKARLLQKLKDHPQDQTTMSQIWDACTHLNRHIQVQFSTTSQRATIFGDNWDSFVPHDSRALFEGLQEPKSSPGGTNGASEAFGEIRLEDVLQESAIPAGSSPEHNVDDNAGSYGSIIDFPNFLLHVLKIKQNEHFSWAGYERHDFDEIRLEDKYLLQEFDKVLSGADASWVRDFGWLLLRTRYLLDTYVIRTQPGMAGNDDENWVIHRAHKYSTTGGQRQLSAKNTFSADCISQDEDRETSPGRRVLMLQAMFQVTDTRRPSKYFLFQTLQWLHRNELNGHLDTERLAQYLEVSAQQRLKTIQLGGNLNQGTQVSNFIFNFLDYILWLHGTAKGHPFAQQIDDPEITTVIKEHARKFTFRYRTSVEHFYPVAPDESQHHRPLDQVEVDHFGNICIMSRSDNSARNNLMPKAKVTQYLSTNQSLKFQLMAETTRKLELTGHTWDVAHIQQHGAAMTAILKNVRHVELPNQHYGRYT